MLSSQPSQLRSADGPARPRANALVTLSVHRSHATEAGQPVTVGVPFARGVLSDADAVCLLDPSGHPVLLQVHPLARWQDGSIRWLLLDFILPPLEAGVSNWSLVRHDLPAPPAIRTVESDGAIFIDTGAAAFTVNRRVFQPLARVLVNGVDVLDASLTATALTDPQGRAGTPRVETAVVETVGPVRATVRLEGTFTGSVPCRFVARLCFFAGTGLVRVRFTLHNPQRAKHPGNLWDLGDAGSLFFEDLSIRLGLRGEARFRTRWVNESGQPVRSVDAGAVEIYQDSSGGESWQSRNHVNRLGIVPHSFRGYRVRAEGKEETGLRASPLLTVEGPHGTLTAAVPEFWQQFPTALEADGPTVHVRLFPSQFADVFELQGGEQKTHTAWLHFGPAGQDSRFPLEWVHHPARVHAPADWYAEAIGYPHLAPAEPRSRNELDRLMAEALDGPEDLFARREVIDEYGWRNFGETYADHEGAYYTGPKPVVSHYNNQYDVVLGLTLQFFRTGDGRWFDLADALARHVIDIDIYHTTQDRAAYNGGLFWLTDHYKDAGTCTHRTFSRMNGRPGDRSYGGGPGNCHNFTTGLLHYHYLTGDPNAREAVVSLADWVVNMEDGTKNVLGLIDPGPTGLATFTSQYNYHGPGRGAGNSINALLDGWLVTGRAEYLEKAEALIRRCVHPADDVAGRDLLNAELRWSYTMFLSVLARYLREKAEAGQVDGMYAYARASLLRYAEWMVQHEVPYFDHPEKLEYPTETWAAQELRKANVLRLAAAHADEPLRTRFMLRGGELAARGWSDLFRFESRRVTRALAVVMVEGTVDAHFRSHKVQPAPRPAETPDFGTPTSFVLQKQRVFTQLKTVRGVARACRSLLSVRNWMSFLRR